jgi:phage repressor protein C with HTH and peptisase S24 domain
MAGTLASNIAKLRKHLGDNQTQFATRLGGQQANVSKYEAGMEPGARVLGRMAELAGCSVADFMDAAWSPPATAPDQPPTRPASAGDDTVEIIQLDLSLPMGTGATVDDYIEETPLRFDLDYIRAFTRTPPARLRLARGVGDSMYPTLVSSDLVWIDSTQTMLNQADRVWAVSINGAAAIKRLRALKGGRVLIVSDNAAIDNYEVDADELLIGGRVIRFARDL